VLAELLEHIAHREGDGTVVDRVAGGRVPEHRDAERTPSGGRQGRQRLVEDLFEQVAEADVDESPLRLGRPGREHPEPTSASKGHALEPERRLADARFALQHQRGR
jgi:hypothetical protein